MGEPLYHPEAAAFVQAICESLADDTPRLVYADWLDDHGDHLRAEFIRTDIELFSLRRGNWWDEAISGMWGFGDNVLALRGSHIHHLAKRANELLRTPIWASPHECNCPAKYVWMRPINHFSTAAWKWLFIRGFIGYLSCPVPGWFKHGPDIVRHQPIETVRLDAMPLQHRPGRFSWTNPLFRTNGMSFSLPGLSVPGQFNSLDEAHAAMSNAVIKWAHDYPNAERASP